MAFLAVLNGHPVDLYLASAVFGFGVGLAYTGMPAAINSAVPIEQSGIANGMNAVFRMVGGAVGTAVLGSVLASDTIEGLSLPTLGAYREAFWITAAGCLIAAVAPLAVRTAVSSVNSGKPVMKRSDPTEESIV